MGNLLMTLRRMIIVIIPLFIIAFMSSKEWVARAQMIEDPQGKDLVYKVAVLWDDTVSKIKMETVLKDEQVNIHAESHEVISEEIIDNVAVENKNEATISEEVKLIPNIAMKTEVVENKKKSPEKILMIGDSLMNEVAFGFKNNLNKSIKIKDLHKSSTGLTNKDYYDWPTIAKKETANYQPDIVFIHMGGNDGQDLKENGKFIRLYSPEWEAVYQKRAEKLIMEIKSGSPNAQIVWIGLPGMRDPKYEKKTSVIRNAQKAAALNQGIGFVDGGDAIGSKYVKQKSINGKMINLRRTDGIHYSREGGEQIALLAIKLKI